MRLLNFVSYMQTTVGKRFRVITVILITAMLQIIIHYTTKLSILDIRMSVIDQNSILKS